MDLFNSLSDDQVALLGCGCALVVSGTVLWISYFLGRHETRPATDQRAGRPCLRLADCPSGRAPSGAEPQTRRKAA